MNFTKWAKTRTPQMIAKYQEYIKSVENEPAEKQNIFANLHERKVIQEFENWVIVENDFPYDAIATKNHLICTKRQVPLDWDLLNENETKELNKIRKEYLNKNYEVIWENLPQAQSMPNHFHLHLLTLIRE